jgi:hypothetical protein
VGVLSAVRTPFVFSLVLWTLRVKVREVTAAEISLQSGQVLGEMCSQVIVVRTEVGSLASILSLSFDHE